MDATKLFDAIRSLNKTGLTQDQVDGVNAILASCKTHQVVLPNQIAYIIATAYHEARLRPVREEGLGKDHPYGQMIDNRNGKLVPYELPNQRYYGRGFVQLTWKSNYTTFRKILGIDLVVDPDLALQPKWAAEIIVRGMKDGIFTGVGLSHYLTSDKTDFYNARKIVNGLDCATLIAGYAQHILEGLI